MTSPQLVEQAARTISEADLRALALAKVKAKRDYDLILMRNTANLTDEELADLEIERARAHGIFWEASMAMARAV